MFIKCLIKRGVYVSVLTLFTPGPEFYVFDIDII